MSYAAGRNEAEVEAAHEQQKQAHRERDTDGQGLGRAGAVAAAAEQEYQRRTQAGEYEKQQYDNNQPHKLGIPRATGGPRVYRTVGPGPILDRR